MAITAWLQKLRVSLRLTVVSVFVLATLLTAAVAISLQYVFTERMATRDALSSYQQIASSTRDYLNYIDARASETTHLLASYPGLVDGQWVTDDVQQVFAEAMLRNPVFYAIYIGFSNGDFYELINLDASLPIRSQLKAAAEDRWVVIEVLEQDGQRVRRFDYLDADFNVRSSRQHRSDYDSSQRPWYLQADKINVNKTAPYLFQHLQAPGQTFSKRMRDADAVIAVDIALSSIADFLKTQHPEQGTTIYLYQRSGEIIASNRSNQIPGRIPAAQPLSVTEAEQAVLDRHRYLNVSNELDWAPIDFAVAGQPYGYAIDILELLAEMLGLKLRFVNGYSWAELVQQFERGQIDILQPVASSAANDKPGQLSDAILDLPAAVVTRPGVSAIEDLSQLNGKRLALPVGWSSVALIAAQYPQIEIVEVADMRALFDAVASGEADAGFDTAAVLHYSMDLFFIEDLQLHQPVTLNQAEQLSQLHMLLRPERAELLPLLNRALAALSEQQQIALRTKWLGVDDSQAMREIAVVPYPQLLELAGQAPLNGLHRLQLNDEKQLVYVMPVSDNASANEFMAIISSERSVLALPRAQVMTVIAVTAALLLLLLPLSWLYAAPIVRPIRQLAEASEHIRHRRYQDVELVDSQIVEIRALSESMGAMSNAIQQHEAAQVALMEAFIELIAQAIDDKSPYTAAHCARVPELALMLAEQAHQSAEPPFAQFSLSEDEWREFRTAAWLHDCGKITTPEHIVDKGSKLETIYNRIHEIRMRFEVLWRDAEIDYWQQRLDQPEQEAEWQQQLHQRQQQLRDQFAFVAKCNIGGEALDEQAIGQLQQLAQQTWQRHFDDQLGLSPVEGQRYTEQQPLPVTERLLADKPEHLIARQRPLKLDAKFGITMHVPEHLYNLGELYNLQVSRGTLTAEDRFKINEHMISTIKMLESLPFPPELARVPRYASTHHETLIGTGYPRGLHAEDLSMVERIMVLADIFEALTAADRPYKEAKPISEAIRILHKMTEAQHVDKDVFALFLRAGIYLDYAERFLDPAQIDSVDIESYLH